MRSLKWLGVLAVALMMNGCIYRPIYEKKENIWSFFEDWDENKDSNISKEEFEKGYVENEMIRKVGSNSKSVTYEEFNKFVSEWKQRSMRESIDKDEKKVSTEASSFDPNNDRKLSEEELARAMFMMADENGNNEVTSLEFYHWEVYL